jgi:hypothetical protein
MTALAVDLSQKASATPVQTVVRENVPAADTYEFREFVDNHVRATTKFKSADDLLTNSKPLSFIWKSFVVVALGFLVISIVNGGLTSEGILGFIILTALFGYVVAFIAGLIIRIRYEAKASGKFEGSINTDELINFLNVNLQYLSPAFMGWEPFDPQQDQGWISKRLNKALKQDNVSEQTMQCRFQGKKMHVGITFKTTKEKKEYTVFARKDESGIVYKILGILDAITGKGGSTNAGFGEYSCIYKSAPILTAAVEYYLKTATAQEAAAPIQK